MKYGIWILMFISTATSAVDEISAGRLCWEFKDQSFDGPCQVTDVAVVISEHMSPSEARNLCKQIQEIQNLRAGKKLEIRSVLVQRQNDRPPSICIGFENELKHITYCNLPSVKYGALLASCDLP